MNNKTITITITITAILLAASAGWFDGGNKADKKLTTTETSNVEVGTSFFSEMKKTEKNQQGLTKKQPIPVLEDSLERQNLIRRYETLNDQNQEFHVYLMSHGKVVSYYVAQGKVSSVNSKLTNPQQFVKCDRTDGYKRNEDCVVDAPQLDGSYGTNGDAIFFYTTDGSYVEWNGEYLVSERPLNIQTPLSLESDVETQQ